MSQSSRPTDGGALRSTRQLLDELDALMNQMAALPVIDDPVPPIPDVAPTSTPPAPPTTPSLAATLTLIDPAEALLDPPDDPAPDAGQPERSAIDAIPIRRVGLGEAANPVRTADDARPDAGPTRPLPWLGRTATSSPAAPRSVPTPTFLPAFAVESRALPPSSASGWLRAALWWDRGFRRATRRFGFLGWAARTMLGRMTLGLIGCAGLAAAAAWLVRDWLRWTG